jgi:UDP-N-acetylmuramoyl-tripeptide--D-alanyl-D-alanine ligase
VETSCIERATDGQATLADLCAAINGRQAACGFAPLANPSDVLLGPIVSDSRAIEPGDVFWALRRSNHQGEDFVGEAFCRGAIGAVVAKDAPLYISQLALGERTGATAKSSGQWSEKRGEGREERGERREERGEGRVTSGERRGASGEGAANSLFPLPSNPSAKPWIVRVDDTQRALNDWARWRRQQFDGTVIAISGSAGKSTAGEMIHAILQTKLLGGAGPWDFNDHVGLPLCIAAIEPQYDYAVLEMRAHDPDETAAMAALARPTIGVITCLGDARLAHSASHKTTAESQAKLLAALPADGRAVLGDDPWLRSVSHTCPAEIAWVGTSENCDLKAADVRNINGRLAFRIEDCQFLTPLCGRHHLTAVLAAIAVGQMMGFDLDAIARTLYKSRPLPMRCQVQRAGDVTFVNDAYASNLTATLAALEFLREFDSPGRRIAVVGDVGESGDESTALHEEIGRQVVRIAGVDLLIACGRFAEQVTDGARAAGMARSRAIACLSINEALHRLGSALLPGDVVLVKGSQMTEMERIVEPRRRAA